MFTDLQQDLAVTCPKFIVAQSPMSTTLADFWQMIYDQGSEVVVMLCVEIEPGIKVRHFILHCLSHLCRPIRYILYVVSGLIMVVFWFYKWTDFFNDIMLNRLTATSSVLIRYHLYLVQIEAWCYHQSE